MLIKKRASMMMFLIAVIPHRLRNSVFLFVLDDFMFYAVVIRFASRNMYNRIGVDWGPKIPGYLTKYFTGKPRRQAFEVETLNNSVF